MSVDANFLFQVMLLLFAVPTEAMGLFFTWKMHFGFAESIKGEVFLQLV